MFSGQVVNKHTGVVGPNTCHIESFVAVLDRRSDVEITASRTVVPSKRRRTLRLSVPSTTSGGMTISGTGRYRRRRDTSARRLGYPLRTYAAVPDGRNLDDRRAVTQSGDVRKAPFVRPIRTVTWRTPNIYSPPGTKQQVRNYTIKTGTRYFTSTARWRWSLTRQNRQSL